MSTPGTPSLTPSLDQIEQLFKSHVLSHEQVARAEAIREAGKNLAATIASNAPPSADTSFAIRYVRIATMSAVQSIALEGKI